MTKRIVLESKNGTRGVFDCELSIILTIQACYEWWHLERQISENLKRKRSAKICVEARVCWFTSVAHGLNLDKAWPSAMRHAPRRGQVRRFTMSTSLIRHVLCVGQTIHVDSFKPSALTGEVAAAGGLPGASLAMTRLSIKGMKRRLPQPRWNLVVMFFFFVAYITNEWFWNVHLSLLKTILPQFCLK